ncbi:MAG TPA: M23 family metallopeptidase [Desulfuromonadales bacterium]|nr:M23 family metallopeptidase [Desulfuromonadales bacterium]
MSRTSYASSEESGFSWPISCVPGVDCAGQHFRIGYPDVSGVGLSFLCSKPGYLGHQGTDIVVSSVEQGVQALAAADGTVRWVKDGLYDHCPDDRQPECGEQFKSELPQNGIRGATLGFNAGNFVIIEHELKGVSYLTLYAHLRKDSLNVVAGQSIKRGQRVGDVASSGNSQIPHLHFGVYKAEGAKYVPVDPWRGSCNTSSEGLWASYPPYRTDELLLAHPVTPRTNEAEVYMQSTRRSKPVVPLY